MPQAANVDATLRRLRLLGAAGTAADLATADQQAAAEQQAAAAAAAPRVKAEALQVDAERAAELEAAAEQQGRLGEELHQLFSSARPDSEAGCIAAIHVPSNGSSGGGQGGGGSNGSATGGGGGGVSLLRVAISEAESSRQWGGAEEHYLVVPTWSAQLLLDAESPTEQLALLESLPACRSAGQQAAQLAALAAAVQRRRGSGSSGKLQPDGGEQTVAAAGAAADGGRKHAGRVFLIPQRQRQQMPH